MNELIKVNEDNQTVSARDLHEALGIAERFSLWISRHSELMDEYGITSVGKPTQVQNNGGIQVIELIDYDLPMDLAKHICMMSKTEKGKQMRQYFIDLEKAWNTPEQILARALKVANETIANTQKQIEAMKPKAEFFDAVADSKTAIQIGDVAKILGIKGMGRNNLFEFLRQKTVLGSDNVPYQRFVDSGYFRIIEQKYTVDGEVRISIKTLVYQKGLDWIRRMIDIEMKEGSLCRNC